ncbi:MAG: hypothetical protein RIR02_1052, partial [Pseudomonadota bacterium]
MRIFIKNKTLQLIATFAIVFIASISNAQAEEEFLAPEQAFAFSAKLIASNQLEVHYKIADGYYLYRERLAFSAEKA